MGLKLRRLVVFALGVGGLWCCGLDVAGYHRLGAPFFTLCLACGAVLVFAALEKG